jgi:hypothetical protein
VVIVGRDSLKGQLAIAELQSRSQNKRVEFVAADLSSVQDTERLGESTNIPSLRSYVQHSTKAVKPVKRAHRKKSAAHFTAPPRNWYLGKLLKMW